MEWDSAPFSKIRLSLDLLMKEGTSNLTSIYQLGEYWGALRRSLQRK